MFWLHLHLSLQYEWTALMRASDARHIECVQVLLDKGAKVNMQNNVSDVIIHCVLAMHHVPRVGAPPFYVSLGTGEWKCGDQDLCVLEHGSSFLTSSVN